MGEQQDTGTGLTDAWQAARVATAYMDEMTGRKPEVVSGVEPEDHGWLVTLEMLELARVPDVCDVMGCYQVSISSDGTPTAYRRIRRYWRGQVDEVMS